MLHVPSVVAAVVSYVSPVHITPEVAGAVLLRRFIAPADSRELQDAGGGTNVLIFLVIKRIDQVDRAVKNKRINIWSAAAKSQRVLINKPSKQRRVIAGAVKVQAIVLIFASGVLRKIRTHRA
jgi:hypothetical protein